MDDITKAVADTAFAALAVALGCDPDRVDMAQLLMRDELLPMSPQDAVNSMCTKLREHGLVSQ